MCDMPNSPPSNNHTSQLDRWLNKMKHVFMCITQNYSVITAAATLCRCGHSGRRLSLGCNHRVCKVCVRNMDRMWVWQLFSINLHNLLQTTTCTDHRQNTPGACATLSAMSREENSSLMSQPQHWHASWWLASACEHLPCSLHHLFVLV